MLALSGLLDNLLADLALGGVAVASDRVGACLVCRDQLVAVRALDVFLALFIQLLLRDKLLLPAEHF